MSKAEIKKKLNGNILVFIPKIVYMKAETTRYVL